MACLQFFDSVVHDSAMTSLMDVDKHDAKNDIRDVLNGNESLYSKVLKLTQQLTEVKGRSAADN